MGASLQLWRLRGDASGFVWPSVSSYPIVFRVGRLSGGRNIDDSPILAHQTPSDFIVGIAPEQLPELRQQPSYIRVAPAYSKISIALISGVSTVPYIRASSTLLLRGIQMKSRLRTLRQQWADKQRGGMGYVLLWLLGVPIPILILISLLRGCN